MRSDLVWRKGGYSNSPCRRLEPLYSGAVFGSDYMNLNTNTRFRLIFGQTDSFTRTASRSAKWIHEIIVELGERRH
jgi:hypothetical protein